MEMLIAASGKDDNLEPELEAKKSRCNEGVGQDG